MRKSIKPKQDLVSDLSGLIQHPEQIFQDDRKEATEDIDKLSRINRDSAIFIVRPIANAFYINIDEIGTIVYEDIIKDINDIINAIVNFFNPDIDKVDLSKIPYSNATDNIIATFPIIFDSISIRKCNDKFLLVLRKDTDEKSNNLNLYGAINWKELVDLLYFFFTYRAKGDNENE